jgi:hypothetical protein
VLLYLDTFTKFDDVKATIFYLAVLWHTEQLLSFLALELREFSKSCEEFSICSFEAFQSELKWLQVHFFQPNLVFFEFNEFFSVVVIIERFLAIQVNIHSFIEEVVIHKTIASKVLTQQHFLYLYLDTTWTCKCNSP